MSRTGLNYASSSASYERRNQRWARKKLATKNWNEPGMGSEIGLHAWIPTRCNVLNEGRGHLTEDAHIVHKKRACMYFTQKEESETRQQKCEVQPCKKGKTRAPCTYCTCAPFNLHGHRNVIMLIGAVSNIRKKCLMIWHLPILLSGPDSSLNYDPHALT